MQTGSPSGEGCSPSRKHQLRGFKTTTNILEEKAGTWNVRGLLRRGGWTAAISPRAQSCLHQAAHPASQAAGSTEAAQPAWGQMCCQKSRPAAEAQAPGKRSRGRREGLRCTDLTWARLGPECRASATILWSRPEISRFGRAAMS